MVRLDVHRPRGQLNNKLMALAFEHRPGDLNRVVDYVSERHGFFAKRQRPARDARHIEQVVQKQRHGSRLPTQYRDAPLPAFISQLWLLQYLSDLSNRCKGIAQLVRERCKEFVLAAVGFGKSPLGSYPRRYIAKPRDDRVF
jgi:hypothetical protein